VITNPNWALTQPVVLGVLLTVFAYLGLRRGAGRELLATLFIVLGILSSVRLGQMFQPWVNRFYRLGRLVLTGGIFGDDPAAAWQEVRQLPDLVGSPTSQKVLEVAVFFVILLMAYLVGHYAVPVAKTFILRLLGLATGVINGFLVAYYLSPYLLNMSKTTIVLPSAELRETLTRRDNVALVLFVFVAVMIAFGLYNAGATKRK